MWKELWDFVLSCRWRCEAPRPAQCAMWWGWLKEVSEVAVGRDDFLFGVRIKHGVERMVCREVCFSEMTVWMHGDSRRPSGVVHQRSIEERVAWWWCHLASIGIFGGLYLLGYGHCLGFDWFTPGHRWCCCRDAQSWCREAFRTCIAAGIVQLVNVDVVINAVCFLTSNGTEESLLSAAEHALSGCMHCVQEGVFAAYIGRCIGRQEDGIGWEDR